MAVGIGRLGAFVAIACLAFIAPAEAASAPPSNDASAALAAVDQHLARWELSDAEVALGALKVGRSLRTDVALRRGQLALLRSDFKRAERLLKAALKRAPRRADVRVALGRALYLRGKHKAAYRTLDRLAVDYNRDRLTSAADLYALGQAMALNDFPKSAHRAFREALAKDPALHAARLAWAELLMAKHSYRDADGLYREVLRARPKSPAALVGLARLGLVERRALDKVRRSLLSVLASAPSYLPAQRLLAELDLHAERPVAAIERLKTSVLPTAKADPEALALLGAAHYLLDDHRRFNEVTRRALKANPRDAGYFTQVAEFAQRAHRYTEAVSLLERALALDPKHWPARAALGVTYSRVGDDKLARKHLDAAHAGDPYDVRTYRMLTRFYDDLDTSHMWFDAGPMKVRAHRDEVAVLKRHVPPLLTRAYRHFKDKYGVTPKAPLHIEIFKSPEVFGVRSVGVPQLAAHGICFGHVVTARSPSAGNFNWAEVLWHELAHVYHIQLSKSRVPRWFTEGLAVWESREGDPRWVREGDAELRAARRRGALRGIGDFNLAFTQATSLDEMSLAYYHASRVAEFVHTRWGSDDVRAMLVAWGEGLQTPAVVERVLKLDVAAFDLAFDTWLGQRLAVATDHQQLKIRKLASERDAWLLAADKPGASAEELGLAALAAALERRFDDAKALSNRALRLAPTEPHGLFARAVARTRDGDRAGAGADVDAILAGGVDGRYVRELGVDVARAAGDTAGQIRHLKGLKALEPDDARTSVRLIAAYVKAKDAAGAYRERAHLAELDQNNAAVVTALLRDAKTQSASADEVRRWSELAAQIAPFSRTVMLTASRALKAAGAPAAAKRFSEHAAVAR